MNMEFFEWSIFFVLQLDVEVVSCTPSTLKVAGSKPIKGFDVVFTDTVLFPEGGGQVNKIMLTNGSKGCDGFKRVAQIRKKYSWDIVGTCANAIGNT